MKDCIIETLEGQINDFNVPFMNELRITVHTGSRAEGINIRCKEGTKIITDSEHTFSINDGSPVNEYIVPDRTAFVINATNTDYSIVLVKRQDLFDILRNSYDNDTSIGMDVEQLSYGSNIDNINLQTAPGLSHVVGTISEWKGNPYSINFAKTKAAIDLKSFNRNTLNRMAGLNLSNTKSFGDIANLAAMLSNNNVLSSQAIGFENCRDIYGNVESLAAALVQAGRTNTITMYINGSSITKPEGITNKTVIRFGSSYPNGYQISAS